MLQLKIYFIKYGHNHNNDVTKFKVTGFIRYELHYNVLDLQFLGHAMSKYLINKTEICLVYLFSIFFKETFFSLGQLLKWAIIRGVYVSVTLCIQKH